MGTILKFLPPGVAFEPEVLKIMGEAFDRASHSVQDGRAPDLVREIIAGRIIRLAKAGERDVEKLCEQAVAALGLTSDCSKSVA